MGGDRAVGASDASTAGGASARGVAHHGVQGHDAQKQGVQEVQGVLFALPEDSLADNLPGVSTDAGLGAEGIDVDSPGVVLGYRGTVASKVAGITYRQLDYWARKHIVEPSVKASHGSGSRRLYSFKDILVLAVSKRLLDVGVNLQNVTTAIGYLQGRNAAQLEDITIMCDGQHVYECTSDAQVGELMKTGNAVFGVSVGSIWHKIHDAIQDEACEEVRLSPDSDEF